MNDLSALKASVVRLLAESLSGSCDALSAFPGQRPLPLSRPAVAVALHAVELASAALGGLSAGISPENPGAMNITLRLDLFAPESEGETIHTLYEDLCAALLAKAADLGLAGISCEPVGWDEAVRAWRLPAKVTLRCLLTGAPMSSSAPIQGRITHVELRRESDVS